MIGSLCWMAVANSCPFIQLIITDENRDDPRPAGTYILHRPRTAYADLLGDGFRFVAFTPYQFRENAVGFLQFIREA